VCFKQASDIGDSMVVHVFGAYFGLAVSRVLHKAEDVRSEAEEASVYHSDLFAMIGNHRRRTRLFSNTDDFVQFVKWHFRL